MFARNQIDKDKVHLILNETHPTKNVSVPDPYYGENQGFENVYILLNEACEIIANKLSKIK
jgi:protein-tyrosine phosphatase